MIYTILNGCLGGLSFGIYHAYITKKMIEEHNLKFEKIMISHHNKLKA
jgi:hypothetical protein